VAFPPKSQDRESMEFLPEAVVIVEGMRSMLFGCSVR